MEYQEELFIIIRILMVKIMTASNEEIFRVIKRISDLESNSDVLALHTAQNTYSNLMKKRKTIDSDTQNQFIMGRTILDLHSSKGVMDLRDAKMYLDILIRKRKSEFKENYDN